jgi:hypothetical protein
MYILLTDSDGVTVPINTAVFAIFTFREFFRFDILLFGEDFLGFAFVPLRSSRRIIFYLCVCERTKTKHIQDENAGATFTNNTTHNSYYQK